MHYIDSNFGFLGVGMSKEECLQHFASAQAEADKVKAAIAQYPQSVGNSAILLAAIRDFEASYAQVKGFSKGITRWGTYADAADKARDMFRTWSTDIIARAGATGEVSNPQPPENPTDLTWPAIILAAGISLWLWSKTRERAAVMNGLGAYWPPSMKYVPTEGQLAEEKRQREASKRYRAEIEERTRARKEVLEERKRLARKFNEDAGFPDLNDYEF